MSKAKDAFKAGGADPVSSLPSSPLMQARETVGSYITGTFIGRKEVKLKKGTAWLLSFKLNDTDMKAVIKSGDEYVETDVEKGDVVGIMAPTRLGRTFDAIADGSDVYIEYLGQDTEAEGEPHVYEVLRKKATAKAAAKAAVGADDEVM